MVCAACGAVSIEHCASDATFVAGSSLCGIPVVPCADDIDEGPDRFLFERYDRQVKNASFADTRRRRFSDVSPKARTLKDCRQDLPLLTPAFTSLAVIPSRSVPLCQCFDRRICGFSRVTYLPCACDHGEVVFRYRSCQDCFPTLRAVLMVRSVRGVRSSISLRSSAARVFPIAVGGILDLSSLSPLATSPSRCVSSRRIAFRTHCPVRPPVSGAPPFRVSSANRERFEMCAFSGALGRFASQSAAHSAMCIVSASHGSAIACGSATRSSASTA